MKTLHWYLVRQVLVTLGMTVAVCTFVLLLGNVLKEIIELLLNRQASFVMVIQAIGLLIPWVLVFALPAGMLTATLLVFGRFSADQELTAARANGISLVSLVSPVLLLSVLLSGCCAWINMQVAQQCRIAYKDLIQTAIEQRATELITEGRFMTDFPNYLVYVGKKSGNQLSDLILSELQQNRIIRRMRAEGGTLTTEATNYLLVVTNASIVEYQADKEEWVDRFAEEFPIPIPLRKSAKGTRPKPNYSDMTFLQLLDEKNDLERFQYLQRPTTQMTKEMAQQEMQRIQALKSDLLIPIRIQLHRQVAFSFACVGFTLIGIPLGIRTHRRETSVGVAIAVVLMAVYYGFIILSQSLAPHPEFAPHLIVWLPNFIFLAIGWVMLWRANRGI
jgi:lipopolysaccharide export system permease protein